MSLRQLDGELKDERWICLDHEDSDFPAEFFWCHGPSHRCVRVVHRGGPHWAEGTVEGWFVTVGRHDDLGNPEWEGFAELGPFELMGEAMKQARSIRRSILAEQKNVRIVEQGELFPEET